MLNSVEEIENEIVKLLIAHEQDLETTSERMDFIVEQSQIKLNEYERTLDEHYADYDEEVSKEAYLAAYKEAKTVIMETAEKLLKEEASGMLLKIQAE